MSELRELVSHRVTIRVFQIAIGGAFIVASLSKIGDFGALATQVHNFRLVPIWSENLIAMTLPWVELLAALALVLGLRARAGAWVVTLLLAVFTVGVAAAMARGFDFECGCFGTADRTRVGLVKILENLAMLAVAIVAARRPGGAA